jgi:hypothetical protein
MECKCLMCRKTLTIETHGQPNHLPSRCEVVYDGGTVEISFGYGSLNDCKTALGYICDTCFSDNMDLFVNHYDGLHLMTEPK